MGFQGQKDSINPNEVTSIRDGFFMTSEQAVCKSVMPRLASVFRERSGEAPFSKRRLPQRNPSACRNLFGAARVKEALIPEGNGTSKKSEGKRV